MELPDALLPPNFPVPSQTTSATNQPRPGSLDPLRMTSLPEPPASNPVAPGPPNPPHPGRQVLDLTRATPAENLALDEALWEACEAGGPESLRFWESSTHFVVVGYANRVALEVDLEGCERLGVPILRRVTGGGTVLQGPGCLNYSLILRIENSGPTASITGTNLHIMNRHAAALTQVLGQPVRRRGDTDLAVHDRKFSGNAQRRGRHALLFHGTFLLKLDRELVRATLRQPSRQPDYRQDRGHADFITNLDVSPDVLKTALTRLWTEDPAQTWSAPGGPAEAENQSRPHPDALTLARAGELARQKYETRDWNFRF